MNMFKFDTMGKPFPTLEDDYENAGYNEFDVLTERKTAIQKQVDARVDGMWQDRKVICRIIEENLDVLDRAVNTIYDDQENCEEIITRYMTYQAEKELGV